MGNFNAGGEDDVDAAGKYLLISVPQFAQDPITGNLMTSYLRLGAASTTWRQDPGGWLAEKIHEAGPPGNTHRPEGPEADLTAEGRDPDHVFIDDRRDRVDTTGHGLSKDERVEQSRVLHTRGGWRDHSDGNRITTTYGDKIEVIRGNYKQMILGRQDDPESSIGLDGSSLLFDDWGTQTSNIRAHETSTYTDADGNNVWHFQSTTEGVVMTENFAGDKFEHSWGRKHYSTTGSNDPKEKGPNGNPRQNPHILEKTWAEKIESYTGSADWPIPLITDQTWAVTTASLTNVAIAITEATICPGVITSSTNAGMINESTTAANINETVVVSGGITENLTAANTTAVNTISGTQTEANAIGAVAVANAIGVAAEVTVVGATADVTIAGAAADVTIAAIHGELELAIIHAALEISAKADIFIGAKVAVTLGAFLDIYGGAKKEIGTDKTNLFLENTWIVAKYCVTAPLVKLGIA